MGICASLLVQRSTTILEQDLFYSSYSLSDFSKSDKLLWSEEERKVQCLSTTNSRGSCQALLGAPPVEDCALVPHSA